MTTKNALMSMKETIPDVDAAVDSWKAYMKLCGKKGILNETDYQKILIKEKNPETGEYEIVEREFKKKSAWQKLARAFNVDTCIVSKEFQRTKTGSIQEAYYCIRASLPNGRSVESDAMCNRRERGKKKIKDHDIMAIAKTRATNRAIAELIGAGEVSSEEVTPESPHLTTVKEEDDEISSDENDGNDSSVVNPEPPELITKCIDTLVKRGMKITTETVKICLEGRFRDDEEYRDCMYWLDNFDIGGVK